MGKKSTEWYHSILNGEDNLLLSGDARLTPLTKQSHTQYDSDPDPNFPNLSYTNEIHLMSLISSPSGIT